MNTVDAVLLEVIRLAQLTNPFATIKIGALPVANSISMAMSGGAMIDRYLDKGATYRVVCVLNGKHEDQQLLSETLNKIHENLTQKKSYTNLASAQITDIETVSLPSKIDVEKGQFLYGSSLRIKFFYRKV